MLARNGLNNVQDYNVKTTQLIVSSTLQYKHYTSGAAFKKHFLMFLYVSRSLALPLFLSLSLFFSLT